MNFTIFTPTRGRVELLKEVIAKIIENTNNLSKVELLLWVDDDDWDTINFLKDEIPKSTLPIRQFIMPRPKSLNFAINFLAEQAKGKYLFNVNDDCQIITKNWDEIVLAKIAAYKLENNIKDDIIYCKTGDNSVDRNAEAGYSSFPIISKQSVDTLGLFMYSEFVGLGGDSSIFRVYNEIGRVVDCSEVQLDHVHHSSLIRVMTPDKTAAEMRANTQKSYIDPYIFDVSKEVTKLQNFIKNYNLVGVRDDKTIIQL